MKKIRIAYIGGGSRGWARGFMSDLAAQEDFCGEVRLYDIDREAAEENAVIGMKFNHADHAKSHWEYSAKSREEALDGADFVVISILPGTFDEMESDVHTPEKYGIYQSVGDTVGPGGIIRALRTIPMMEEIAEAIRKCCPNAWVINYTNPMTVCMRTLYRVFPKIKAFGCCHEVFGTQNFLVNILKEMRGIKNIDREEIKINVVGVNHFTWLTAASYQGEDLFPLYRQFALEHPEGTAIKSDDNWMNNSFASTEKVKLDLFLRYGYIAAAGDRHLAEFCRGSWYLKDPACVDHWHFGLTGVAWRKEDLAKRLEKTKRLVSGEENVQIAGTGEDGVKQIRALLGLGDLITNVNIPNAGQIPNLPLGVVVETNALFRADSVQPVCAGEIPKEIYGLIAPVVGEQELVAEAGLRRDLQLAYCAFSEDNLVQLSPADSKALFDEMVENTRSYLESYK